MALGIDEVMFIKQASMLFVLCALGVFRNHRFAGRIRAIVIFAHMANILFIFSSHKKAFGCDAYSG